MKYQLINDAIVSKSTDKNQPIRIDSIRGRNDYEF